LIANFKDLVYVVTQISVTLGNISVLTALDIVFDWHFSS